MELWTMGKLCLIQIRLIGGILWVGLPFVGGGIIGVNRFDCGQIDNGSLLDGDQPLRDGTLVHGSQAICNLANRDGRNSDRP